MKKLDEITIADLMPDSISGDAEVSATARAIDPQLKIISEGVDLPLILAAIDTLGEGVLEHLAAQYDLTAWDSAWPIDTKRAVLKTAIADKRKKGTRGAVQRAIEAVAPIATITEWWQTQSEMAPHTFRIDVLQDGSAVDAETQADVIAQVNDSKPVRSHFTLSVGQKAEGNMYLSGVIRTIAYARVRSSGMTAVQTEIDAGVLATLRGMNIRRIMEFSHMGEMPEPTPPAPALPTVSVSGDFSVNNWLYAQAGGGVLSISAGESRDLYKATSSGYVKVLFDTSKKYAVLTWYSGTGSGDKGVNGSLSISNTGYIAAKNETSSSLSLYALRCAVCSSPDATVIAVYDNSNNPYNAFKYTSDGTDYYYVLDGTQTDWTDDLESIGYHVPVLVTSYLTYLGASATTNFGLGVNSMYQLYDSSGSMLLYDSTKTYSIISANRINSQYPDWSSSDLQSLSIGHNSDYLYLVTGDNIPYHNEIYSVTYTVL